MPGSSRYRNVDTFFNEKVKMLLGRKTIDSPGIKVPKVNTNDDSMEINISLPGYKTEQIAVYVYNTKLRIAVRDEDHVVNPNGELQTHSFTYDAFDFEYTLPDNANIEALKAWYDVDGGILSVRVPTRNKKAIRTSRKIHVNEI